MYLFFQTKKQQNTFINQHTDSSNHDDHYYGVNHLGTAANVNDDGKCSYVLTPSITTVNVLL